MSGGGGGSGNIVEPSHEQYGYFIPIWWPKTRCPREVNGILQAKDTNTNSDVWERQTKSWISIYINILRRPPSPNSRILACLELFRYTPFISFRFRSYSSSQSHAKSEIFIRMKWRAIRQILIGNQFSWHPKNALLVLRRTKKKKINYVGPAAVPTTGGFIADYDDDDDDATESADDENGFILFSKSESNFPWHLQRAISPANNWCSTSVMHVVLHSYIELLNAHLYATNFSSLSGALIARMLTQNRSRFNRFQ